MSESSEGPSLRHDISKRNSDAIKAYLRVVLLAASIGILVDIAIILVVILFAIDLLDVKLIISLVVAEVPLAVFLSYLLGERKRTRLQDSLEMFRASKELNHLIIHKFVRFAVTYSYIENAKAKSAFEAPFYFNDFVEAGMIRSVRHDTEEKLLEHFKSNSITIENRKPTSKELE